MKRIPMIVALLAGTAVANAQPAPEAPQPAATSSHHASHRVTIMWAPLRMIIPLGEVTGEVALQDKVGVSVTLGAGKRTLSENNMDVPGTEVEGGAQARYYVLGNFTHGMELGGEVLYEYVKFKEPLPSPIVGAAAGGLTVGPFLGYKIATHAGFTFEAQLGARYIAMDPPVTGMAAGGPMISQRWLPLLHLNIGWSF